MIAQQEVERAMKLVDLIDINRIRIPLKAGDKNVILEELASAVAATEQGIDKEEIVDALTSRERQGPFSLGRGIAFPHARLDKIKSLRTAIGVIPDGCDFKSADGSLVHIVILFVIPKKHSNLYLSALAAFLNFFSSEENMRRTRSARTKEEIIDILSQDMQTVTED